MKTFPDMVQPRRWSAHLAGWALMMIAGFGTGLSQEAIVDYRLTGPMIVEGKKGVVIEKLRFHRRLPPGQVAVQIRNSQDVIIRGCAFTGIGAAVLVEGSRMIRVEDCAFVDLWEHGLVGPQPQIAVEVRSSQQITVSDSLFEFVSSGLYAYRCAGVVFSGNMAMNMLGPFPRGQAVQFNGLRGPGNRIERNFVSNEFGKSAPQDCVNLFQSYGTADSPILIENNHLMGDPESGSQGMSSSGSGIMAGDGGGGFQVVRNNRLDSPGQVGIGVAGGGDILLIGNTVRGTRSDVSNVGIAVWNQYRQPGGVVTVMSNIVGWRNQEGKSNDLWFGKAKYGPACEFSQVAMERNESVFPEQISVDSNFIPAAWMLLEGKKYSRHLRELHGDLEKLFDPTEN